MKNPLFIPFRGIRYNSERVQIADVVTPPYDVISDAEREKYYQQSSYSMIRLDFAKPLSGDNNQENRYTRAADDYRKWLQEGILVRDRQPGFYLYEQHFSIDGKKITRRGLFGLRRLEAFGKGRVFPHEKTIAGPKADRLLLMKACGANFSSIFGIYSDPEGSIQKRLDPLFRCKPIAQFQFDGVEQRLWLLTDPQETAVLSELLSDRDIVIADGHHRYETALTYRDWRLAQDPKATEHAPFRYVLMYLANRDEAVVQPTHRVVRNIPGFDRKKLEARLHQVAKVSLRAQAELFQQLAATDSRTCRFGLAYPGGEFRLIEMMNQDLERVWALESISAVLRSLDVAVAHKLILEDLFGLSQSDQTNPQFVEFVKSREAALNALQDSTVQCVLLMTPPDLAHMEHVVHSGLTMPPKTTYFYPKLLTGLVINLLSD